MSHGGILALVLERDTDIVEATDVELDARVASAKPDADPVRRALWHARSVGALFGVVERVMVGRYELLREVAEGGGGVVFVAKDPDLGREIAIKLISLHGRALAEAQALARLAHPNVVAIFDVGVIENRIYIAMELVEGEALRTYADHASAGELLAAYHQVGEGLHAAHAAGIVHGDFKPDNAVIGRDGRVRLVDFGLASVEGEAGRGGTPRYMAPEQLRGHRETSVVTAASDQYAFAIALGEAFSRATKAPPPRRLARILAHATAAQPSARYPSMRALLAALTDAAPARVRRRRRIAFAVIAVVAVALAAFVVWPRGVSQPTASVDLLPVPHAVVAAATPAFERAEGAFERGDFSAAGSGFRNAYEAYPTPELLWNLAVTNERAGRCHEALRVFDLYLLRKPSARAQERAHIEKLRARCVEGR